MRFFSTAAIFAVSALSSFVAAAPQVSESSSETATAPPPGTTSPTDPPPAGGSPNPISNPTAGTVCKAGEPCTIEWEPTTDGTVTLKLRMGSSTNLDIVETIIDDLPNSGSYTWTPKEELEGDDTYAIEIVDASGNSNYSPQFTVDSEGTGVSSSTTTTTAPTTTITSVASTSTVTTATPTTNSTTTTGTSTTTSKPKPTIDDSEEDEEENEAPNPNETGAANGLLGMHSPMALILCVGAAMAYLS